MKHHLTESVLAKAVAYFLCVLLALAALCSAAAAAYLSEDGYYTGEHTGYTESAAFEHLSSGYCKDAWLLYYYGELLKDAGLSTESFSRSLDPVLTNYRYAIYFEETGARVAGTSDALPDTLPAGYSSYARSFYYAGESDAAAGRRYIVLSTLADGLPVNDDLAVQARAFSALLSMKYGVIVLAVLFVLLSAACFTFLMCAAGRHETAPSPECRGLERIPFDLYVALAAGVVAALCYLTAQLCSNLRLLSVLGVGLPAIALILTVLIAVCMSFAARIKCKNLIKNTVVFWILSLVWRFVRWVCRGIAALFTNLPVIWRAALGFAAYLLLNLILVLSSNAGGGLAALLLVLFNLAAFAFVCALALQMRRLQAGADALAAGDFTKPVDEKGLLPAMKRLARALSGAAAGMARAVEARMKSERMKTDLITNVSHDLKTPLTSIVNYVDLLKKEDLPEGNAKAYVEVLDRQSQRLKKLAEDVVEASKASSGAINVNLQPTDIAELMRQSAGEYAARFAECGLSAIVSAPETPLPVMADGRLLWRALDNLLSNAAKYAMPGTRVYLDAAALSGGACIRIRNVSKEPLNIDPAELTERFVRGDSSRSAEGSGLGLSIAQSLVALMGGTLTLTIDGDLFRAEIALKSA